jgi:hypothetical protein
VLEKTAEVEYFSASNGDCVNSRDVVTFHAFGNHLLQNSWSFLLHEFVLAEHMVGLQGIKDVLLIVFFITKSSEMMGPYEIVVE